MIDREALLLYLSNIVDLEATKEKLSRIYWQVDSEYKEKSRQLSSIKINDKATIPPEPKADDYFDFGFAVLAIFLIPAFFFIPALVEFIKNCNATPHAYFTAEDIQFTYTITVIFMLSSIALLCYYPIRPYLIYRSDKKYYHENYSTMEQECEQYNAQIDADILNKENLIKQNDDYYKPILQYWSDEFYKADGILQSFYGINIIPKQHRTLAATYYMYEYLSSAKISYKDLLYHAHMEDGIRRIENKLDQVTSAIYENIYETRCMREETKQRVNQIIDSNMNMLNRLKSIEQDASTIADYQKITSDYTKANAFFSLANYFKK